MGWDLVLEYSVSSAAVAHGWSHYFQNFLSIFHLHIPAALTRAPFDYFPETGRLATTGTLFDLPALVITALVTILLVKGIKESATVNTRDRDHQAGRGGAGHRRGRVLRRPEELAPVRAVRLLRRQLLRAHASSGKTGMGGEPLGVLAGAAMIFFAYIGFDSLSTHAEEARNPKRDIPIGIITSLILCTVLYIAVAAVLTGMVPYDKINIDAPVADAFAQRGLTWMQFIISIGALAGITSVLLVMMLSQPRILLAMARDGMVPAKFFGAVHPRFRTPWKSTILTGTFVGLTAALAAAAHPGRAGQHRHAAGVRHGLRRRADLPPDATPRPSGRSRRRCIRWCRSSASSPASC